ncbi:hypothetical protein F4804DRAFT_313897 [Jackrogersella minutella]|nr:hypothetical protein F4804DRAFT_313897 [Jackrogersella minutella]
MQPNPSDSGPALTDMQYLVLLLLDIVCSPFTSNTAVALLVCFTYVHQQLYSCSPHVFLPSIGFAYDLGTKFRSKFWCRLTFADLFSVFFSYQTFSLLPPTVALPLSSSP